MKKFLVILTLVVGNFLIVGTSYSYSAVGYMKCETVNKLVEEENADVKNMIMFWFSGYYTGRNPEIPDPQLIYIATVNYCNNNPLKDTVDLADYLYSSLI